MEINIGKKKFILKEFSLHISSLYDEYVIASNQFLTVDGDFEEIRVACELEREEASTKADKLRAELKMLKEAIALREGQKVARVECNKMRDNIVKEIFGLNEYDWKDDYLKHIAPDQFTDLIDELTGKKKVVEPSS